MKLFLILITSGPPAFLYLQFSPNPLNVFSTLIMHFELFSYQIKVFNFVEHLLIPNFCCNFDGLLSLKQCDYYWANFVLIMLYLPLSADVTDTGINPGSKCFPSRPTRSSLFNRMLMTCFTRQNKKELLITWF